MIKMKTVHQPAFTLVETLMVMVILAFVMVAASSLASTVLTSSDQNQKRVQAVYLTQQCSELLRNVRDSAWRQNLEWSCPFTTFGHSAPQAYDPIAAPTVFAIESLPLTSPWPPGFVPNCQTDLGVSIVEKSGPDEAALYRFVDGLRHDNSGDLSEFRRYFTVDVYDDVTETITLTCHTNWADKTVQMTQQLTNWRNQ